MNTISWLSVALSALCLIYLIIERLLADRYRKKLVHIIHVNGIRGKSTVTRLIGAGLAAGGLRVMTKTTGTLPMVIDPSGRETLIKRHAPASIHEQFFMLRRAARCGAEVLVIECMAIDPALQAVCQHKILRADIGVITNVRHDHTDIMGSSLPEIAEALMNTIPKNGVLFTADADFFDAMREKAERLSSRAVLSDAGGEESPSGFPENEALAAAVCAELGVEEATARKGMAAYHPDPYAFCTLAFGSNVFLNALSCNDVDSTMLVYQKAMRALQNSLPLILLINDRADRPERTRQMLTLAKRLEPKTVLLLGDHKAYLIRALKRALPETSVRPLKDAASLKENDYENSCILAVGNIKNEGMKLIDRLKQLGENTHE